MTALPYILPFVFIIFFFLLTLLIFEMRRRQTKKMLAEGYSFGVMQTGSTNIIAVIPPRPDTKMESRDDNMVYVYVLAPITALVAVGVITYITIQSRRLRKEMIESGQLVGVVPAVVTVNTMQGPSQPRPEIRSPDGLPPPPPYSKY